MKKLLLIEPDQLSGGLYKDALEAVGYKVAVANSAQLALDELDKQIPDCILLEIDMIGHNGLEFLYEFCSHDDWAIVPVILHTGITPEKFEAMMVDWSELNVVEYLYKPQTSLNKMQIAVMNTMGAKA